MAVFLLNLLMCVFFAVVIVLIIWLFVKRRTMEKRNKIIVAIVAVLSIGAVIIFSLPTKNVLANKNAAVVEARPLNGVSIILDNDQEKELIGMIDQTSVARSCWTTVFGTSSAIDNLPQDAFKITLQINQDQNPSLLYCQKDNPSYLILSGQVYVIGPEENLYTRMQAILQPQQ